MDAAEADLLDGAFRVADFDPVADFEQLASKDGEGTEEVGDRVLGGEGDGDADDSRASEQWRDFHVEEILEDEQNGDEPDDGLDDAADQIKHQLAGGVGLFVLPPEMLRPRVVDDVDDAEDSREEDDDEKGEEGLVHDGVDLAGEMDKAVAVGEPREQEEQGDVHGQPVDESAQAGGEPRGASADDVAQDQQDDDGEKDRDEGADAAGGKLRLVVFEPVADLRGVAGDCRDDLRDAFFFRRRRGAEDGRRVGGGFLRCRGSRGGLWLFRGLRCILQVFGFYGIR